MGLRTLRTLVAIAETGGFTAAAVRLHLTQSAVSMQMKALESEWRMPLFDRSKRPPILNEAGWRLVKHGRKIIEQYDVLKRAEALAMPDVAGTVHLGVVPSVATGLLPEVLAALRRDVPALTVRVRSGLSPDLLDQLGSNRIDAAIVTGSDRIANGRVAWTLRTDELKLYVCRELAQAGAAATLTSVPFIHFTAQMGIGRIIDFALRERGIAIDAVVEMDSIDAMLRMVRLGLGAAILPAGDTLHRDDADLTAMSLDPPVTRSLTFITRAEFAGAPNVQTIRQAFAKQALAVN